MGKASRRKHELRSPDLAQQISESQPVEGDVCDFCGVPDPEWGYRTREDPTEPSGEGGWAACDECHRLIEGGRHDALARRALVQQRKRFPLLGQLPAGSLLPTYRGFQDEFRRSRDHTVPALRAAEYERRFGPSLKAGRAMGRLLEEMSGLVAEEHPGDRIARPVPSTSVLHRVQEGQQVHYIPEGFTADQLVDPKTIEYIMERISADRPAPNVPLTQPIMSIKQWVGARTYVQAAAAAYGENPRANDCFDPQPAMMVARMMLEPILNAHPLVLEPEQLNAIDASDWSFPEAGDYAQMAHLPFEPIYLDFGGHEPVMVELEGGPCRLYGAVVWRSGFFKVPTLAVAPIGGHDYLYGPFSAYLRAKGVAQEAIDTYIGRTGKEGELVVHSETFQRYHLSHREIEQWRLQPAGICWFGIETSDIQPYVTMEQTIRLERGDIDVPLTFSTETAIANALDVPRERVKSNILTGVLAIPESFDEGLEELQKRYEAIELEIDHNGDPKLREELGEVKAAITAFVNRRSDWAAMMRLATEMVAKLAERALLGLYFIENAPVQIESVDLKRPERREMERKVKKGKDPGRIASIVIIRGRRSESRSESFGERNYTHRWERRGHFRHYHDNTRHYQNRPELIRPCHRCSFEYEENLKAQREGRDLPFPRTESPDCIKQWIDPVVCGPEDLPLKKKVRIRKADDKEAA